MEDNLRVISPIYFFNEEVPGYCLAFIQDENDGSLLCGREDGSVTVWDLRTLRLKVPAVFYAGSSRCLSISVCNEKLITQDKTGIIKCWVKSGTWNEVRANQSEYYGFCKLSVNSDLSLIACPTKNCSMQIYNFELTSVSICEPDESENVGYVMGCKFVKSNGQYFLLVAYENGDLILWDLETNNKKNTLNVYKSPVFALDYDDYKNQGICGSNTKKLSVFTINDSKSLECIHIIKLKSGGVGCIRIHPRKEIIAVSCWDNRIRIFSWSSYKLLSVLSFHSQGIEDMCFSPKMCEVLNSECVLFAVSRDKKISAWNVSEFF